MEGKSTRGRDFARQLRIDMPDAAGQLWFELKAKKLGGFKFRREHPIAPYVVDFACVKERLVIEVDGATHSSDTELAHDKKRTAFLNSKGWHVIRFWNDDIYDAIDWVLENIHQTLLHRKAGEVAPKGSEGVFNG